MADERVTAAKVKAQTALDSIREELREHPYRTLAVAAGVGFAIGAGLAGPILGLLGTRAGRLVLGRLLDPMLDRLNGSATWSTEESPVH